MSSNIPPFPEVVAIRAPPNCPHCFNENDCESVLICRAIYEVYNMIYSKGSYQVYQTIEENCDSSE